jgi:hypothetical protein
MTLKNRFIRAAVGEVQAGRHPCRRFVYKIEASMGKTSCVIPNSKRFSMAGESYCFDRYYFAGA